MTQQYNIQRKLWCESEIKSFDFEFADGTAEKGEILIENNDAFYSRTGQLKYSMGPIRTIRYTAKEEPVELSVFEEDREYKHFLERRRDQRPLTDSFNIAFQSYLDIRIDGERREISPELLLWAYGLECEGWLRVKVRSGAFWGSPLSVVPSAIFFDLASRCGLVWTDIECQYTLEELMELAKRNTKQTEAETAVQTPKPKGRKRKIDPKEAEILRVHKDGQRHAETAEIANVKTTDGRLDVQRVRRILRADSERKRRKRSTK